jgi:hypothetical protein
LVIFFGEGILHAICTLRHAIWSNGQMRNKCLIFFSEAQKILSVYFSQVILCELSFMFRQLHNFWECGGITHNSLKN